MSKKKSELTRELELRKLRAETVKAEAEAAEQEIQLKAAQRDHAHTYEWNPHDRGIFAFDQEVRSESVAYMTARIQRYAHLNPPKDDRPGGPITLYIQSPGGSVLPGLAMYDALRTLSAQGHHITTVVRGYAASFGATLLQAGDTRLVGAESLLMIHELSSGAFGKFHEMKDELKFLEMMNRRLFAILADRTEGKWTADSLYERVEAKDWWLPADEAVEQGFADAVG